MEPLTIETLRTIATLQGLELTDQDLAGLLPLVAATQSMMAPLREALSGEDEPACQYRIL